MPIEKIIINNEQELKVAKRMVYHTGNNKPIKQALEEAIEAEPGFNYTPITSRHRILEYFYIDNYVCTECGRATRHLDREILVRTGGLVCEKCQEVLWR